MNVDDRKVNWPALNWLVRVLADDTGRVEWVRMTAEEQAIYDKERPYNAGYPYKVVKHPIPKGNKIVLKCSGKYVIKCDSDETRNLIIEMAIQYKNLESLIYHLRSQLKYEDGWHKVEE